MREEIRGPGRPREFDESAALDAMMGLFWEKGFEGASLADIMTATGLKKASLYAAFGDKRSMYLNALAHYHRKAVDAATHALRANGDPLARIKAFVSSPIDAVAVQKDRRGCFLCNASADQAALSPETSKAVKRGFDALRAALAHALADLSPSMTAEKREARAWMLLSVYSGLRIMARSGLSTKSLETARDEAISDLRA
jgi:AcrR family transcriptional regulator